MTRKRGTPAPAVIDACCLIDLLASGRIAELLEAAGCAWHLPRAVKAEVQFVRPHHPARPGSSLSAAVDLSPHLCSRLLTACHPTGLEEHALFVQYAAQFRSDGEAMCLAIAEARGWLVATDDRKAIRVAQNAGLSVVSCPELVKKWADATRPTAADLAHVLLEIQDLAKFLPRPAMPDSAWWAKKLGPP